MISTLILAAAAILTPCQQRDAAALCTTIQVPENRSIEAGRTIDLNIVVVPAGGTSNEALFILAGGPGMAATRMTGFAERTFGAAGIDIVLVDIRGTGNSNPLRCALSTTSEDNLELDALFLPADVEACRDELAERADLTQYNTREIVRDLREVRSRLGYDKVSLYGTSYGTRVALEWMRQDSSHLRSVILDGVVPPSMVLPVTYPADAEEALRGVFALCLADQECSTRFPRLQDTYDDLIDAVEQGIRSGEVTISRGLFGEVARNYLYSPRSYQSLPLTIENIAREDWSSFERMTRRYLRGVSRLDSGLYFSVTCTEDVPLIDEAAARRAADGTLLGTFRLDQQLQACRSWPKGPADSLRRKPVASSVPTLIISGELDPVTPPRYGDEVAQHLPNSRHVIIPHGSHSGDEGTCLDEIMTSFLRAGSSDDLDLSCLDQIPSPRFLTVEEPE